MSPIENFSRLSALTASIAAVAIGALWLWVITASALGSGEAWEHLLPRFLGSGVRWVDKILSPVVLLAPIIGIVLFVVGIRSRISARKLWGWVGMYAIGFVLCFAFLVRRDWNPTTVGPFRMWTPDTISLISKPDAGTTRRYDLVTKNSSGSLVLHAEVGEDRNFPRRAPQSAKSHKYKNHFGLVAEQIQWGPGDTLWAGETLLKLDGQPKGSSYLYLWYEGAERRQVNMINDISLLVQPADSGSP